MQQIAPPHAVDVALHLGRLGRVDCDGNLCVEREGVGSDGPDCTLVMQVDSGFAGSFHEATGLVSCFECYARLLRNVFTRRRVCSWIPACRRQEGIRARRRRRVEKSTECAHQKRMTSRRRQIASRANVYGRTQSHELSKWPPGRAICQPDTVMTCCSHSS